MSATAVMAPVPTPVATVPMPERYGPGSAERTVVVPPQGARTQPSGSHPPAPPPPTPQPSASGGQGHSAPGGETRRSPRPGAGRRPGSLLIAGVAVACIALGTILGIMVSVVRMSDASQAIADAQRARDAAFELQTEVTQQREDLNAMRAELEEREQALRDRESELTAKESELTTRQQELEDQAAQQQQQQQQRQQEQQNEDQAWFYWSCKDARKAGAAPIERGEPGYRSGLDNNGNGVACEDGEG